MKVQTQYYLNIFFSAIFAGICIGIAGFGFLTNPTIGMFLFIFGLSAIVNYQVKLFTGTAGFLEKPSDIWMLLVCLVGNLVGCYLISLISMASPMDLALAAEALLTKRLSLGWLKAGTMAIGCGILMSASVDFARKGKDFGYWAPLCMAVPLFILCGFPHCIADAFYYMSCSASFLVAHWLETLVTYISIIIARYPPAINNSNILKIILLFLLKNLSHLMTLLFYPSF